jgi:hypothetical protein
MRRSGRIRPGYRPGLYRPTSLRVAERVGAWPYLSIVTGTTTMLVFEPSLGERV